MWRSGKAPRSLPVLPEVVAMLAGIFILALGDETDEVLKQCPEKPRVSMGTPVP